MNLRGRRGPRWPRGRMRVLLGVALGLVAVLVLWTLWAESAPATERALRLAVRDQLEAWFPDELEPAAGTYGIKLVQSSEAGPVVVLLHGLDEPGDIWDDLIVALEGKPLSVWKFEYPNDQAIDRSAAFLARSWGALAADRPVTLVGHSMGGLVGREFVSRWRHPAPPRGDAVNGAPVRELILVGTPNHGSEWARLRVWLELRDHLEPRGEREFSLFAALRDGAGVAKIDLRPGSAFLETLNARPWPGDVRVRLIAGDLTAPTAAAQASLEALVAGAPGEGVKKALRAWWEGLGPHLGDGVVTIDSVRLPGLAEPVVLPASHRGLLRRSAFEPGEPPATPLLLEWILGERAGDSAREG